MDQYLILRIHLINAILKIYAKTNFGIIHLKNSQRFYLSIDLRIYRE
jgi:hypothetical protein